MAVAFLNAAVIAVVFTVVCKFDQAADIDAVSVMVMPHFSCQGKKIRGVLWGSVCDQMDPLVPGQSMSLMQFVDQQAIGLFHLCILPPKKTCTGGAGKRREIPSPFLIHAGSAFLLRCYPL